MRAAEEAYPGYPGTVPELMERAGAAVAYEAMRVFPYARRFAVVCGGGSNGGDGRVAARVLRDAGREAVETDAVEGCDVVVDALFGTGFRGPPRPGAAAIIERINASGAARRLGRPSLGRRRLDRRGRRAGRERGAHRHVPRRARSGSTSRRAASTPARSWSPTSASRRWRPRSGARHRRCCRQVPLRGAARLEVHGRIRARRRRRRPVRRAPPC